jgi:AcrR family transcriptional regulator
MDTPDRRVIRTKKRIKQALLRLAIYKGYENITIQQIADAADIGHRTFYRHYENKDELLFKVLRETLAQFSNFLSLPMIDLANLSTLENPEETRVFDFVKENQDVFRLLLLDRGVSFCLDPVIDYAAEEWSKNIKTFSAEATTADLAAHHIVTATFSLLRWWFKNDMLLSPRQMNEITLNMILLPALETAGLNQKIRLSRRK